MVTQPGSVWKVIWFIIVFIQCMLTCKKKKSALRFDHYFIFLVDYGTWNPYLKDFSYHAFSIVRDADSYLEHSANRPKQKKKEERKARELERERGSRTE